MGEVGTVYYLVSHIRVTVHSVGTVKYWRTFGYIWSETINQLIQILGSTHFCIYYLGTIKYFEDIEPKVSRFLPPFAERVSMKMFRVFSGMAPNFLGESIKT